MTGALVLLFALGQADELRERLDVTRVEALTRRLSEEVAQHPSGAGFASAIAGSPGEAELAEAIATELAALGLSVRRERFPVRRFEYGEVRLEAAGATLPAITLHSGGGTWGTWDGVPYHRGDASGGRVVEGTLVDAGRGYASDYERLGSVEGRIVLVEWTSWPGLVVLEAAARGAAAILLHDYPGTSLDAALKQNTVIYHDAVPSVSISIEGAARLKKALSAGPVTVRLENRVDAELGFSENVLATLPGTTYPDEWVAVSAHHDRWFRGAQDDAVGVAVLVELARLVAGKGASPRRSHLFVSFGSEETGGVDAEFDWLTGSYAFVRAHPEIVSRLAYAFNVDGAGWPGRRGYLYGSLEVQRFHEALLETLGLTERVALERGVTNWVDAWSLAAVGGASAGYLLWFPAHGLDAGPDAFSPYYHTQFDRVGARPYTNLDTDLLLGALALARMDEADHLPLELSEVARWVLDALDEDEATLGTLAAGLRPELDEARRNARDFLATASARERSPGEEARIWNRRLLRARRELVPWLLSMSSSSAVLKTTPYAEDAAALHRAVEAAGAGDSDAAAHALGRLSGLGWGAELSSEAYRAERLMSFAHADWSREFRQNPAPAPPEIHEIYRAIAAGALREEALRKLAVMESIALANVREMLFLVAGKLRKAEAILAGDPVLGAPPVERSRRGRRPPRP